MARPKKKPPIDICRVDTTRLRQLSAKQLEHANVRVGRTFELPKKERGETRPRYLISRFINELRQTKPETHANTQGYIEWHQKKYGRPPEDDSERSMTLARKEVDRLELKIWDMQAKKGCKLSRSSEYAARDATRAGTYSEDEVYQIRHGRKKTKIR